MEAEPTTPALETSAEPRNHMGLALGDPATQGQWLDSLGQPSSSSRPCRVTLDIYSAFLSLGFLICKMGLRTVPKGSVKTDVAKCLTRSPHTERRHYLTSSRSSPMKTSSDARGPVACLPGLLDSPVFSVGGPRTTLNTNKATCKPCLLSPGVTCSPPDAKDRKEKGREQSHAPFQSLMPGLLRGQPSP